MNRDTMSRTQLIALVKELEAQNAELRDRSGENTLPDTDNLRAVADTVVFDSGERLAAASGTVKANYFKAVSEEIEQIEHLLSCGGDLNVTRVAQPKNGWIKWGEIAAQHGSVTDEAIAELRQILYRVHTDEAISELRQGLDRILEEVRELRRDIEADRPRSA